MSKNMNVHMHTHILLYTMKVECLNIRGKCVSDVIFRGQNIIKHFKKSTSKFSECYSESLILGDPIKKNLF